MKKMLSGLVCFALAGNCLAQAGDWLTVMGDRTDPAVNTIEVNPTPVSTTGEHRVMKVRVSRSVQRTNWDGIAFRSYLATVDFDCTSKTAQFQQISYFAQPLWAGDPHITTSYTKADPRPMRFRGVEPNPVERIIRAACLPLTRNPA
ncbi:MAG: surface-adhesin E family protein [Pseudomonadota bacterium]